jgi:capsular polysaccharide biosynthesis protein
MADREVRIIENGERDMTEEIDLLELMQILLKRKWLIIALTILGAAMGLVATMVMVTPVYQADTTLMVSSSKGSGLGDIAASIDLGSLNLSQKLVVTYSEIVKSRIVLEQVIEKLSLPTTYEKLLGTITSKPVGNTEILKISVQHPDPAMAAQIANKISDVFIKEVMRIMKVSNVEIIDAAIPLTNPINYRPTMNAAIGGVLGGMLSVGIAFLLAFLDRTIKTAEDVKKHLGLPVLGSIVDFDKAAATDTGKSGHRHHRHHHRSAKANAKVNAKTSAKMNAKMSASQNAKQSGIKNASGKPRQHKKQAGEA